MGWLDWFRWAQEPAPVATGPIVTAVIPSEPVVARFRCITEFWSRSFQSRYVVGGIYSLRAGNDKLANKIPDWIEQGKVELL